MKHEELLNKIFGIAYDYVYIKDLNEENEDQLKSIPELTRLAREKFEEQYGSD